MKNWIAGILSGVAAFAILSWATPKAVTKASVLSVPPEGRFQLVQLHASSAAEWSAILDTETGCAWAYTSQTPPTDADVSAAPEGEQRAYKTYQQALGTNFLAIVDYDDNGPSMSLPWMKEPSTVNGVRFSTLATEEFYCNEARQNAIKAAAAR